MRGFSSFLVSYFAIALVLFVFYLQAFLRDESTAKSDRRSWWTLAIASLLWLIVLPISLGQLLSRIGKRPTARYLGVLHRLFIKA